jgi:glucokinase
MLLAGDVGGTKTSLSLFDVGAGPRAPRKEATFPSEQYPSLEAVAREFLLGSDQRPTRACFGVAGPVFEGRATITNLSWEMAEDQLADALSLERVHLINDLESIANAIPLLEDNDLHTLNDRDPAPGGAIAVIAPGTGLGEAFLTWNGWRYDAHPSEGGHTDFAPTDELQLGLLRYLQDVYGHVSWERVCSGMGIPNIYGYLKSSGAASEPDWLAEALASASDVTPVIVNHVLQSDEPCELCLTTVHTFVSILGAEAGNMALKILATGGVYLGGGIPPRIVSALDDGRFMNAFRHKGRFRAFMVRLPVHVILNPRAALLGAARCGMNMGSQ